MREIYPTTAVFICGSLFSAALLRQPSSVSVYNIFSLLSIKKGGSRRTQEGKRKLKKKKNREREKKKSDEEGKGEHTRGERFAKHLQPLILTAFVAA